jgi:hypothetical protein
MDNIEPLFLTPEELLDLTGRKLKHLQIEELKRMLIPFRVNALGKPVVTRAAVLGMKAAVAETAPKAGWTPRLASRR